MHINGSLPTHIARAYGFAPAQAVPKTPAAPQADKPGGPQATGSVQSLLAGRVNGPVDFDGPAASQQTNAPALPLYTRAADKVEAAVAVQVGRTIDVKG